MKWQKKFHIGTGASSILMIFVILCMTTFGILSFVSAHADYKLTKKTASAAEAYYEADAQAQAVIASVDGLLSELRADVGLPAGDTQAQAAYDTLLKTLPTQLGAGTAAQADGVWIVSFTVAMAGERALEVSLEVLPYASVQRYAVQCYRSVNTGDWQPDDTQDLWPGPKDGEE